ncbi:MAG: radical SAM family heme chaperone HemW [Caldilineae bacterium]|nr:MAG: radical SAM family heme chaperone HemW [Caldilineae bacterium]
MASLPLALYLHIPFCQRKCPYCDFNTYAGQERLYDAYVQALSRAVREDGERRGHPRVRSLFLGGGTPTVLEPAHLRAIFAAVREGFRLQEDAEITSEANPGTVDQSRFQALRACGVNRLSMGVQSFDDEELRFLGRIHTAAEAEQAMQMARRAGFDNINLDLIFGLPGQRMATWQRTLDRAIALAPRHLSLYSLTVEPDTPLATWVARGQVAEPDPDLAADLYELAGERLAAAGYHQYEISNWAEGPLEADGLPRYACRHNLVYWRNEPYLGYGPGAHSYDGRRRWSTVRSVPTYIAAVERGETPIDFQENISPELEMGETMMLGLRLVGVGVSRQDFRRRFGRDVADVYQAELAELAARELLEITAERVRLTPAGRLLGNEVFAAFLPDEEGADMDAI